MRSRVVYEFVHGSSHTAESSGPGFVDAALDSAPEVPRSSGRRVLPPIACEHRMTVAPILLSILALPGFQGAPPPERAEVVRRLVTDALARGEAYSKLQDLCREAPHRLAGSPGNANAVAWALRRMEADGLVHVRAEPCAVPHWERGRIARLEVVGAEPNTAPALPILALGGSVATKKGGLRARVVRVQSFDELHALGAAARGKLVFFDRPMDPAELDPFHAYGKAVDQRSQGAIEAARVGGIGAIVRSMTLRLDDLPHTGAMRYEDGVEKVPAAAVSTAGAARLAALLREKPEVELEFELDCATLPDGEGANVIGEIVGRERPDEFVVVGGHLDAWDVGQGAHDDGAGCVEAMEALRLVRASGFVPRRTLRCVLWTNEENGLRGGRAYAKGHAAELDRHVLALESDRGGFAPRGFETNATGTAFEELARIVALLEPYGAGRLVAGGGGADTSPIEAAGKNVAEFLPDPSRYFDVHHCARDTIEAVHPRELEHAAGVIAAFAWCVADLEAPLAPPKPAADGAKR